MPIYCDEAGYTGYNLLEENQPFFVYAALDVEEDQAAKFIDSILKKYKLQGEPKGANWVKSKNGRSAITELFETFSDQVRIVFHHKKYALACKYYEYVFEPTISDYNGAFYRLQFHRFIANLIYVSFEDKTEKAEDLFWTFQELLKGNDPKGLFDFLSTQEISDVLISMVAEFTVIHRETILEEIMTDGKFNYWVLDLAQTALHSLLCEWSMKKGALKVIIDESKPLRQAVNDNPLYHRFHTKLAYFDPFGSGETAINFSLSEPVQFSKSRNEKGLQMADLFASSVYFALKNPDDEFSSVIMSYSEKFIPNPNNQCIVPEPEAFLDINSFEFLHGVTALNRLLQFSRESPVGIGKKYLNHMNKEVSKIRKINGGKGKGLKNG